VAITSPTSNSSYTTSSSSLTLGGTAADNVGVTQVMWENSWGGSVRVALGLATFAWTDSTLTPGSTPVKAVDLNELRTAVGAL